MRSPTARLNLRVPTDLLQWAKEHADENNTTVTRMVVDFLTRERKRAGGKNGR